MNEHARRRQQRYRQRKKEAGFHRLEVWIPADVMDAIERRWKPFGPFCRPQLGLIELARRGARIKKPKALPE